MLAAMPNPFDSANLVRRQGYSSNPDSWKRYVPAHETQEASRLWASASDAIERARIAEADHQDLVSRDEHMAQVYGELRRLREIGATMGGGGNSRPGAFLSKLVTYGENHRPWRVVRA